MERTFHPGAAKYGNFINYYEFNCPEPRLKLMQDSLTSTLCSGSSPVVVLDVGCNSGDMTVALYNHFIGLNETSQFEEVHVLGVDLDSTLIQRANETNPYPKNIRYSVCDVMHPDSSQQLASHLREFKKPVFDFGFCLSISMWIHLNHGDDGLKTFLLTMSTLVKYLVIEPQPWKCYKSAVRRMHRLDKENFSHFHTLKHRHDIVDFIKRYLTNDCHMKLMNSFGETSWGRPIWLFEHTSAAS